MPRVSEKVKTLFPEIFDRDYRLRMVKEQLEEELWKLEFLKEECPDQVDLILFQVEIVEQVKHLFQYC